MRLLLAIVLVLAAHGAAQAGKCKAKGTVLFRETTRPLAEAPVRADGVESTKLTIYATGAWTWVEGDQTRKGCLTKVHLKELKRTLGKAKFRLLEGMGTCRAISTREVIYASPKRKKKVVTAAPCGTPVDEWTQNLASCAEAAPAVAADAASIRNVCRGIEPG